jgi:hypothetical protein
MPNQERNAITNETYPESGAPRVATSPGAPRNAPRSGRPRPATVRQRQAAAAPRDPRGRCARPGRDLGKARAIDVAQQPDHQEVASRVPAGTGVVAIAIAAATDSTTSDRGRFRLAGASVGLHPPVRAPRSRTTSARGSGSRARRFSRSRDARPRSVPRPGSALRPCPRSSEMVRNEQAVAPMREIGAPGVTQLHPAHGRSARRGC